MQAVAIPKTRQEIYPKRCSLPKDITLQCCCFSCFPYSMFGSKWEAVGVKREKAKFGDKMVGLKLLLKTGSCGFMFLNYLTPYQGTERKRLDLTLGNIGQVVGRPKQNLCLAPIDASILGCIMLLHVLSLNAGHKWPRGSRASHSYRDLWGTHNFSAKSRIHWPSQCNVPHHFLPLQLLDTFYLSWTIYYPCNTMLLSRQFINKRNLLLQI